MWRLTGGSTLALNGEGAVAVVTDGSGFLGECVAEKGDCLVIGEELSVSVAGPVDVVLCMGCPKRRNPR
jgi:hypothetical protein